MHKVHKMRIYNGHKVIMPNLNGNFHANHTKLGGTLLLNPNSGIGNSYIGVKEGTGVVTPLMREISPLQQKLAKLELRSAKKKNNISFIL